jgi:hypothetical protein
MQHVHISTAAVGEVIAADRIAVTVAAAAITSRSRRASLTPVANGSAPLAPVL